jgi:hypothetical protein
VRRTCLSISDENSWDAEVCFDVVDMAMDDHGSRTIIAVSLVVLLGIIPKSDLLVVVSFLGLSATENTGIRA